MRQFDGRLALRRQFDLEVAQSGLAGLSRGLRGLLAGLDPCAQTLDLDDQLALRRAFPHLVEQLVGVVLAENAVRLRPHQEFHSRRPPLDEQVDEVRFPGRRRPARRRAPQQPRRCDPRRYDFFFSRGLSLSARGASNAARRTPSGNPSVFTAACRFRPRAPAPVWLPNPFSSLREVQRAAVLHAQHRLLSLSAASGGGAVAECSPPSPPRCPAWKR